MDFKISDTNKGKKSLIYDGFIYRIDGVKKCKGRLRTDSAMSTIRTELHKFADKLIGSGDVLSIT